MSAMAASREICAPGAPCTRRDFIRRVGGAAALALRPGQEPAPDRPAAPVALVKGQPRAAAVRRALELLGPPAVAGRDVFLKGSYNSAEPFPASTDPEMLRAVVRALRDLHCRRILLVERSGMGVSSEIWHETGLMEILKSLQVTPLPLESLEPDRWRREELPGSHWKHGVEVPWFLGPDACVVQICNLKAHRFGAIYSGSLKNSVGLLAKRGLAAGRPYNYMEELHSSPDQRLMIAEINQLYEPAVVLMDATRVMVEGGPDRGKVVNAEVILASRDRVAVDAAGVALLRLQGAAGRLARIPVFQQEQIRRAAELGLGVRSAAEIDFLPADEASRRLMYRLNANLSEAAEAEKKPAGNS